MQLCWLLSQRLMILIGANKVRLHWGLPGVFQLIVFGPLSSPPPPVFLTSITGERFPIYSPPDGTIILSPNMAAGCEGLVPAEARK